MKARQISDQDATQRVEQEAMERDIVAWREWWEELCELGRPHFGEMGDRLAAFREHLAAHFAHEETSDLLSTIESVAHTGSKQVDKLRDEQRELLAALDDLIGRLHCCEPAFASWSQAREEFEEVLDRLHLHEEAKGTLIERLLKSDSPNA